MNIYLLIGFTIFCFLMLTLLRKRKDVPVLMAISIGAACNANLWTSSNMPLEKWGMIFDVGSVLYILCVFTIFLRVKDYSIKDGKSMALTSITAIMISAFFEVFARAIYENQFTLEHLYIFSGYAFSSLGTFVGVWLMIDFYKKLEKLKVNPYIEILICITTCAFVNTLFSYGGVALVRWMRIDNFLKIMLGTTIIKFFAIGLSMLSYLFNHTVWLPDCVKQQLETKNEENN